MPTQWKRDDRVYVKSDPEVVGTVIGHCIMPQIVMVALDSWHGPFTGMDGIWWVMAADLDYYTLPCPDYDYSHGESLDELDGVLRYLESKIGAHADSATDQQWYYPGWEWLTARYEALQEEVSHVA